MSTSPRKKKKNNRSTKAYTYPHRFTPTAKSSSPSKALWLIGGTCTLVAGMVVLNPHDEQDDPAVTVQRANYRTEEECKNDWNAPQDCASLNTSADNSSSGSGPSTGGSSGGGSARWHGPYYTQAGEVYHADGRQTQRTNMADDVVRPLRVYDSNGSTRIGGMAIMAPAHAMEVEQASLRKSSLTSGTVHSLSTRTAATQHAPVVSRGGFTSSFHGRSGGG